MKKRLISEYFAFVLMFFAVLFFLTKVYIVFLGVLFIWYVLFGFVGIAFILSTMRYIKLSNFFIMVTLPKLLLPFRKSFYFWVKSVNIILKDPKNVSLAYEYAQKVNIDNLYTDNNKSMFYSYLASIYADLNQKELFLKYLDLAKKTPHKKMLDITIGQLEKLDRP